MTLKMPVMMPLHQRNKLHFKIYICKKITHIFLCIYKYTHMHVYSRKICYVYTFKICIYNINCIIIDIYMEIIAKYIVYVCVFIYT